MTQKLLDYYQACLLDRSQGHCASSLNSTHALPALLGQHDPQHQSTDLILLVDLGIRTSQQLQESADRLGITEAVRVFLCKCQHHQDSLAADTMLYSHDVGQQTLQHVSVARIPVEIYSKLDLARRLADVHLRKPASRVAVVAIDQDGEAYWDADMMAAILSAWQMTSFPMPAKTFWTSSPSPSPSPSSPLDKHSIVFTGPYPSADSIEAAISSPTEPVVDEWKALELAMEEAAHKYYGTPISSSTSSNLEADAKKTGQQFMEYSPDAIAKILHQTSAVNTGTNLARSLTAWPPNILHPQSFREVIHYLAKAEGWAVESYQYKALQKMGCGAFCATIQGNQPFNGESEDAMIKITYKPSSLTSGGKRGFRSSFFSGETLRYRNSQSLLASEHKPVVLVGKGVTYDTGGLSLKTANQMKSMKTDMGGAAAALGLLYALSLLDFPYPVECWLALAENNIAPQAYRPDDVVVSAAGQSIEIVNTDAEGRLLLVDTLAHASRLVAQKSEPKGLFAETPLPAVLIDFATLTGTAVVSLTTRYIAVMTNREDFAPAVIAAGKASGERMWPLPIDNDLADDLTSDIADTLQCRVSTVGDHLHAAFLLQQALPKGLPWFHLDLASAYRPEGLGHVPTACTGSGVRAAHSLLMSLVDLPR
eukprot:gene9888-10936_t